MKRKCTGGINTMHFGFSYPQRLSSARCADREAREPLSIVLLPKSIENVDVYAIHTLLL